MYNFEAGSGKFFIGAGPDVSFGIGGKAKSNFTSTTTINIPGQPASTNTTSGSDDVKIKFDGKKATATDKEYHLKGLDFGVNALVGYKLSNGAFISAGYTIGLSNIEPNDKQTLKNSGFNVKIGFMFGGNKSE